MVPLLGADTRQELARLAGRARGAWDQLAPRQVSSPAPPGYHQALAHLRAVLEAAGVTARHADWTVTAWTFSDGREPVEAFLDRCDDNGPILPPAPRDRP